MKRTYKYSIVEECEDGKSNKAILENIVPAYFVVQESEYIQNSMSATPVNKATNFALHLSDSLVKILNSTKGLQCVAKYLLSSSRLCVVGKSRGTELNHTAHRIAEKYDN